MKAFEHARSFYLKDLKTATISDVNVVFAVEKHSKTYTLIAFGGKRSKPDIYASYSTLERLVTKLNMHCEGLRERHKMYDDIRIKRNAPNELKQGMILSGSWGYEQTNQEFCEVLEVKGQRVVIQELEQTIVATGTSSMSGHAVPVPGKYKGNKKTCVVQHGNNVRWNSSCRLSPWNGKPQFTSWYG